MNLAELHAAVTRTLASKRLGTPVFVRYLLHGQDKAGTASTRLAQITAVVRDWIGQGLERVYAVGTEKAGSANLTLEFQGGATALVCWTNSPGRGPGVDLLLLGNHGAIYHDAGTAMLFDEPAGMLTDVPPADLQALVERALRSGRPEMAGGKP